MRASTVVAAVIFIAGAIPEMALPAQAPVQNMAVRELPPEMNTRYVGLHAHLQPSASKWVESQARIERKLSKPNVPALKGTIQSRFGANSVAAGSDIEAMAFLVLMEATNDANNDLKAQMAAMKANDAAKQQLRELEKEMEEQQAAIAAQVAKEYCEIAFCQTLVTRFSEAEATARQAGHPLHASISNPITYGRLRQFRAQLQHDVQSLGDLSTQQQLEVQTAMSQVSNFEEALSNILKKISKTNDAIVQNLK